MKRLITFLLTLMTVLCSYAGKQFTLDDAIGRNFHADRQRAVTPLPDGEQYAVIEGNKITAYSYKTGKKVSTLFDAASTVGEKVSDIDEFILSPDASKILVATNRKAIYRRSFTAEWYIYNVASRKLDKLSDNGPQQAPVWSNDGTEIAFVRDNNIFLIKCLYDNAESQVTKDGKFNSIINGIPDWVNEEEFSFNSALCFTADGSQICWIKYDETNVPQYKLQLFKGLAPERTEYSEYPGEYAYKYPKAGQQNSSVTAWSFDIKSKKTEQLQLPLDKDGYICRIIPTDDPQSVLLLTLNRHQDNLSVFSANPRSTVCRLIASDKDKKYIPEMAYSNFIVSGNTFLLVSDRDGYRHLYLYGMTGTLQRSICPSGIDITDVYGYNAATGDVFYQAAPTPMTRHIYVSHKNGKIEQLSQREGTNDATFSSSMAYYFNTWSDRNTPYVCTSNTSSGKQLSVLVDNKALRERLAQYDMPVKELFSFTTSEGVKLNGWMMKPVNFDASKRYPVIMHQYSGPASQQVLDAWSLGSMGAGAIYDAFLCSQGFIVVTVDGRGTGARGADFEKCTYLNLGALESKDQVETAIWLGRQSYVNKDRIGIWGWSFGGFNTLMSMSEGRPVFCCGVAIAPPTNWKFYDTIYTERYMRTPRENPDGYATNPISRAKNLHGALLICHGLADDNVHPQNTFEYSEALVQADKDFRELIYTNRNHSIFGGNTRKHLLRQVTDHFVTNMK